MADRRSSESGVRTTAHARMFDPSCATVVAPLSTTVAHGCTSADAIATASIDAPRRSASRARIVERLGRSRDPRFVSLPFASETPSEAELRIAQAQLVGWLEGLFHGIQTAIYAQQMAARAQLEQMRRALPPGASPMPGQPLPGMPGAGDPDHDEGGRSNGMYL